VVSLFPGFHALEIGQHVGVAPALGPLALPAVEIGPLAAGMDRLVDGEGAAHDLAAPRLEAPPDERRLRLGRVAPVVQIVAVQQAEPEGDVDERIDVAAAGVEHEHAVLAGFAEPGREHAAGRTGTDHDVVVLACLVHGHFRASEWFQGAESVEGACYMAISAPGRSITPCNGATDPRGKPRLSGLRAAVASGRPGRNLRQPRLFFGAIRLEPAVITGEGFETAAGARMPLGIAEALRREAQDCLRVATITRDPVIKRELISAAAWLHEEAQRLEKLANGGGGGPGSGSPPPRGGRKRAAPFSRMPPRYQHPAAWRSSSARSRQSFTCFQRFVIRSLARADCLVRSM
jgi:hypothetical protein